MTPISSILTWWPNNPGLSGWTVITAFAALTVTNTAISNSALEPTGPIPGQEYEGYNRRGMSRGSCQGNLGGPSYRPVWLRTCHCMSCISSRFLKKEKEKRAVIASATKRIEWVPANPCDCWDHLCTGCSWEAPVTEEDGNECGESHAQGYVSYRVIPLEANCLDLVKLPRQSWRRGEYPIESVASHTCLSSCSTCSARSHFGQGDASSAVHSDAKSEEWAFVREDMLTEDSSVDWYHCCVASL